MNFLRRAGAILMVVAIFASSCNKYADDFDQVNKKLDAMATQLAGVTQITTDVSALKSQITALQTALAALPTATQQTAQFAAVNAALTAHTTSLAAIDKTVKEVAAAGTATKVQVDKLVTDLTALSKKVTDENAKLLTGQADAVKAIAALDVKVTGLDTKMADMAKTMTDLAAAVAAVQAGVTANTAGIAGLVVKLDGQATAIAKIGTDLMANTDAAAAADAIAAAAAIQNATDNAKIMADQATIIADIAALKVEMAKTGTSTDTAASLTIQGMQLQLALMNTDLKLILANQVIPVTAVAITGTAQVGVKLTADLTPAGAKATYQWQQGSTNIDGATSSTYTISADYLGKTIRVKVTGTGNNVSSEITSASTAAVAPATPLLGVNVSYGSGGVAQVGNLVYVVSNTGVTPNTTAVSYQWQVSSTLTGTYTDIASATSNKYYPVADDATKFLRVAVTGTGSYTGTVTSTSTAAVIYPSILGGIAGFGGSAAQIGVELTAGATTPAEPSTTNKALGWPAVASYQWQISADAGTTWTDIPGKTTTKYTPVADDLNKTFRVKATGINFNYGTVFSTATAAAVYPVPLTGIGVITGTVAYNQTLTAGTLAPAAAAVNYQWQIATVTGGPYTDLFGATSSTYVPVAGDVGKFIRVVAVGKDGYFGTQNSAETVAVVKSDITSAAFTTAAGANNLVITLTGGSFITPPTLGNFVYGGTNLGVLGAGTVLLTRTGNQVVTLTFIGAMAAASDNTVKVLAANMTTQATSVAAVANVVTTVTSLPVALLTAQHNYITVTLNGGTFRGGNATGTTAGGITGGTGTGAGILVAADFAGAGTDNLVALASDIVRVNSTTARLYGFINKVGVNDVVTVNERAMATQATTVSVAPGSYSAFNATASVASGAGAIGSTTVAITLTTGTFVTGVGIGNFNITAGTLTAADLALINAGTVVLSVGNTVATITHAATAAAGTINVVVPATSVAGAAQGVVGTVVK